MIIENDLRADRWLQTTFWPRKKFFIDIALVVRQNYDVYVEMEHAILGNDAIFKCKIPSHVADLVSVVDWVDDLGGQLTSHG